MGVMMICDSCGKPITGEVNNRLKFRVRIEQVAGPSPRETKELAQYELCEPCMKGLRRAVEGPEPVKEKGPPPGPPSPPRPPPGNKFA